MEMRSSKEIGILNDYEAGMEWQRVRNMSFSRLEMIRYWGPRTLLFDASDILVRNLESGRLEASLPLVHIRQCWDAQVIVLHILIILDIIGTL
jgi:hypothetical protein